VLWVQLTGQCVSKLLVPARLQKPPSFDLEPPEDSGRGAVTVVVVVNALGWMLNQTVVIPVSTRLVTVTDAKGFAVATELLDDPQQTQQQLRFHAAVPPLGAASFFVRTGHLDRLLLAPPVQIEEHMAEAEADASDYAIGKLEGLQLVLNPTTAEPMRLAHGTKGLSIALSFSLGVSNGFQML